MGLDVYLYRYRDLDAIQRTEREAEEAHDVILADEKRARGVVDEAKMVQEGWDAYFAKRKSWNVAHGLSADGNHPGKSAIREPSKVDPDHMFKIGYLRSSYNEGGINCILDDAIGKDLYYVFFGGRDSSPDYIVKPEWAASLTRAREVRDAYAAHVARTGNVRVSRISFFGVGIHSPPPSTTKEALSIFVAEKERREGAPHPKVSDDKRDWYSGASGHFNFGEPMKVLAILPGAEELILARFMGRSDGSKREPVAYVVWQPDPEPEGDWYARALAITVEMIEWVLGQPDPSEYLLHWSG